MDLVTLSVVASDVFLAFESYSNMYTSVWARSVRIMAAVVRAPFV